MVLWTWETNFILYLILGLDTVNEIKIGIIIYVCWFSAQFPC